MDELRKLSGFTAGQSARDAFKSLPASQPIKKQIPPPPPLPELISIRDGRFFASVVDEDYLGQLGTQDGEVNGYVGGPTLEMVVVSRREDDSIDLSMKTFNDMVRNMKIDPVTLQHVYLCSYGFYHYGDCGGAESFDNGTRSFFFGNFLFSVVWSFDMDTEKTSAIVLLRTIPRHYNGTLPLMALKTSLETYMGHLRSPLSLAFILHSTLAHVIDDNLKRIVGGLRSIERDTAHGPSSGDDLAAHGNESSPYGRQDSAEREKKKEPLGKQDTGLKELQANETLIEDLTQVAKELADVNVHLANMDRHAKLLKSMATTLKDESFRKLYCQIDESGRPGNCAEDTKFYVRDLASLYRRLAAAEPTIEYLQARAKGQHQVVFGLLTHEDAMVNLRVARANVSIASAARDDSSAMKTIALMTMIFLPGTFFAALFDQPTLNWEPTRPGVIQPGFGIYWALTVPLTLFVLITSWVMHRGWKVFGKERGGRAQRKWIEARNKAGGKWIEAKNRIVLRRAGRTKVEGVEKTEDNGSPKGSPV